MPRNTRAGANSLNGSVTELPAEKEDPRVTLAKPSKSAYGSATQGSETLKSAQHEPTVARERSNRMASQSSKTDEPSATFEKPASSQRGKQAEDANVTELETRMQDVNLKVVAKEPRRKPAHIHEGEYFNPLPILPVFQDPQPQLFVWGAGHDGQFGLGTEHLTEFSRPRKHSLAENMMKAGKLGPNGSGFVALAAGGMSSLFIDAKGTVRLRNTFISVPTDWQRIDMVVRRQ